MTHRGPLPVTTEEMRVHLRTHLNPQLDDSAFILGHGCRSDRALRGMCWDPLGSAKSIMAPQLAYGRHRGPLRSQTRRAAVAVYLYQHAELGWTIPLTRRPTHLRHHGGQICFPGGRIETGESPQAAAFREFEEELGVAPDLLAEVGRLPRHFVFASNNVIDPVVALIRCPESRWQPDPSEVDEVIEIPLERFVQEHRVVITRQQSSIRQRDGSGDEVGTEEVGKLVFDAPAFEFRGYHVWGATAMILDQLVRRLLLWSPRAA
ncbi:MAG: CoA pyrophosphatase [Planctomycetota bacterium]